MDETLTDDQPLTTQEAADFLGLKRSTLETWRVKGTGPAYHQPTPSGAVRYFKADLISWLTQRSAH